MTEKGDLVLNYAGCNMSPEIFSLDPQDSHSANLNSPFMLVKDRSGALQRLADAGGDVKLRLFPGLGHSISKEGLDLSA